MLTEGVPLCIQGQVRLACALRGEPGGSQAQPTDEDEAGQSSPRPLGPPCGSDFGRAGPTSAWGPRTPTPHTYPVSSALLRALPFRGVWGEESSASLREENKGLGSCLMDPPREEQEREGGKALPPDHASALPRWPGRWQSELSPPGCPPHVLPTSRVQTWPPPATSACPCPRGPSLTLVLTRGQPGRQAWHCQHACFPSSDTALILAAEHCPRRGRMLGVRLPRQRRLCLGMRGL